MEETNRDFMLLEDEDDDNNMHNNNKNTVSPHRQRQHESISPTSASNNKYPSRASPATRSPVSTISIQRPRSSGQMKIKGLDDYIETFSSFSSNSNTSNNHYNNDNRIKINLPIEDISIKNENLYKTLDDHSFMTGDNYDDIDVSNKRSSRRQSLDMNANQDDENDDDLDDSEANANIKYKYTASYKIDETTGSFKENSKILFEKNEQKFSQQQQQQQKFQPKKPPPPVPPPPSTQKQPTAVNNEFIQSKNQENKKFFSEFLTKSDDLIAKTQMKLEELSKKSVAPIAPSASPAATAAGVLVTVSQPIVISSQPLIETQRKIEVPSTPNNTQANLLTTSSQPTNSKSLIDLKSFDVQLQNPIEFTVSNPQPPSDIDLLLDINHGNEYCLNTEPLKQGDSYFDLIGLTKSESQYRIQQQQQQQQSIASTASSTYPVPKELLNLSISNAPNVTPMASPYKDEFLEFITNDNLLCFAEPKLSADTPMNQTSIQKENSSDLLGSIDKALQQIKPVESTNIATSNVNLMLDNGSKFQVEPEINRDIALAPEIQITEPLNEKDDDNIVPDGLFNLRNEVPYNQSRPITPALPSVDDVAEQIKMQTSLIEELSKNLIQSNIDDDIFGITKPSTSTVPAPNANTATAIKISNDLIDGFNTAPIAPPTKPRPREPVAKPESSKFQRKNKNQRKVKKYSRKDGVMSNDDQSSSSSSEEETNTFQIRIRPRAQSTTSLNEDDNRGFQLLSKPPKTAEEIQNLQLSRRQSQESLNQKLRIENADSSEDEIKIKPQNENDTKQATVIKSSRKASVLSEISVEMPDEDDKQPLTEFLDQNLGIKELEEGWILMIRYPLRNPQMMYKNALQKITEIRAWTETIVKIVEGGKKLKLFYPHDPENCFHEVELKAVHKFSELALQQYDTYTKIHTFKIQEIVFKEMIQMRPDRLLSLPERFLKHFTKPKVTALLDHTPIPFEVVKFAHLNYKYLRTFLIILQENFWKIPVIPKKKQREQLLEKQKQQQQQQQQSSGSGSNILSAVLPTTLFQESKHAHEELTVKVIDEYKCKLDKECRIKEHRCRTRVFLVAFLNVEEPIIEIGLNDCMRHGKEIVGRYDIIPIKTETWISPEMYELNESVVNKEEFDKTHCLRCVDVPDNQIIEIMRYRTRPRRNFELPLRVSCSMTIVKRKIEIKMECMIAGTYFTKVDEVFCENIQIRFPLPDTWVYLFRVEKRFRYGALHSTKAKFGKLKGLDRFLLHKSTGSSSSSNNATLEASCGHAKYEQAFKSIVWRIDQLPLKNKDVYKTQLFLCRINLQEYDTFPEKYEPIAEVQYTMPICAASKSQVRSISVNTTADEPPNKWVKLKTKFDYELDIEYIIDQENDELPTLNTENFDELKHISQTESEDNNEEDDDDEVKEDADNLEKAHPTEATLIDLL